MILLHSVQNVKELAYHEALNALANMKPLRYIPIVPQDTIKSGFVGSITDLLQADDIHKYTHCHLNPNQQQMMLCGHPEMMINVTRILRQQGWHTNQNLNGQITQERDWSTET